MEAQENMSFLIAVAINVRATGCFHFIESIMVTRMWDWENQISPNAMDGRKQPPNDENTAG